MDYLFLNMKKWFFFLMLICLSDVSFSQIKSTFAFKEMVLRIDTSVYTWSENTINYQSARHLYFQYEKSESICEIELFPYHFQAVKKIYLLPSADYELLDSITKLVDYTQKEEYYRFKVRFSNLDQSSFLSFNFLVESENERGTHRESTQQVRLLPFTNIRAKLNIKDDELFIGEERVYEIEVNKPQLIVANNTWTENEPINYKVSERNGKIFLHLFPNEEKDHSLRLSLSTSKPMLENGKISFSIPLIENVFKIKQGRLAFLEVDKKDIILEDNLQTGIEIQIEHHHKLQMRKTYRIEKQEEAGGYLVGELFTKSKLSTNKVLAVLRLYALHRTTDGYLYLKEGDKALFITNFDIIPKMRIDKVSMMKEGGDWLGDLSAFAGENVEIRIEGESLNKANFRFDGLSEIRTDSVVKTERVQIFKLRIPLNIAKRRVVIYNNNQPTSYALTIREYQRPHEFNFIDIDFGDGAIELTKLHQPILYYKTVPSIVFSFHPELIDKDNRLFGKQIISIDIKITNANRQLVELTSIPRIVVCPADNSPRYAFYDKKDCNINDINLNNHISRKTHELEDWSRIELTIRHKTDEHGGSGFTHRIEIILAKHSNFDIDVSFPAGLLTKKIGDNNFGPLGGISIAAIAQFKFYRPNKIAQLKPYRIGVGALALDAFNLRDNNTNRDLSLVVIGSVYPTRRDAKLSFPLFLGFGYLIKQERWFYLLGPGIRVSL
jgi:hypothetical protein